MDEEGESVRADVARWVRHYRKLKGWTQKRLEKECHINNGYISRIERSVYNLSLDTLERLSDALSVPVEALMYGPLEFRMMDDTHQQRFDEGYCKAIDDITAMVSDRIPTVMDTIHGAVGQKAFRNILKKLRDDPEVRELFRSLNGKAVVRVLNNGEVDEIC